MLNRDSEWLRISGKAGKKRTTLQVPTGDAAFSPTVDLLSIAYVARTRDTSRSPHEDDDPKMRSFELVYRL